MANTQETQLVHIGTSGWNYREWRGKFYPAGLPAADELEYTANQFNTIEINSSFYRLTNPNTWRKWAGATPPGFQYAVKGWKDITHRARLKNAEQPLATFFNSGPLLLEDRLGPFLWQLPPSLKFDLQVLQDFLALLPQTMGQARALAATAPPPPAATREPKVLYPALPATPDTQVLRHALEPRSEGWDSPEALELFDRYNVALVQSDIAGRYPTYPDLTSGMVYVRLHGSPRLYFSNYSEEFLQEWASKVVAWRDSGRQVYIYFDNTGAGHAPNNALRLMELSASDS